MHDKGIVSVKRDLAHVHDKISSMCNRNVTLALKCMANQTFRAYTPILSA